MKLNYLNNLHLFGKSLNFENSLKCFKQSFKKKHIQKN